MKNTIKTAAVIALSLFAAACAKVTTDEPSKEGQEIHFIVKTAENVAVKSYLSNLFDGTYAPLWTSNERMAIFVGDIVSGTEETSVLNNTSEDPKRAQFEGKLTAPQEGYFKGIIPAERVTTGLAKYDGNECVGVNLGNPDAEYVQNPVDVAIDENCDILVSKPTFYTCTNGIALTEDVFFKRVMSVVRVNVIGPETLKNEKIKSLKLTADDGVVLSGRAKIDVTNARVVDWTVKRNYLFAEIAKENDQPIINEADFNTVYYVANPTTLIAGSKLVVTGETTNYTINKEVTLSKDIVFPESQIAVINLKLNEDNLILKSQPLLVEFPNLGFKTWGETASFSGTTKESVAQEKDGVKVLYERHGSSLYANQSAIRFYKNNTLQFTAPEGFSIVGIEFGGSGFMDDVTSDDDTITSTDKALSWKGSASSVTFTRPENASGSITLSSVKVSLQEGLPLTKYWVNIESPDEKFGSISASALRAIEGTEISLTAAPKEGYEFTGWTVLGTDNTTISVSDDKFTMPAQDVFVSASFSLIDYSITKNVSDNGSFIVKKLDGSEVTTAHKGDVITLWATPDEGYVFNEWIIKDDAGKSVSVNYNKFTMPASNVTISASFKLKPVVVYDHAGTAEDPYNIADVIKLISTLGTEISSEVYAKGIIRSIKEVSTQYGNATYSIGDDSSSEVIDVFRGKYLNGTKFTSNDQIQVGDEIIVKGKVQDYKGAKQFCANNQIVSLKRIEPCATPVITVAEDGAVSIACATAGATIHYTVGDSPADPTEADAVFSAVTLIDGQTIKAIAVAEGFKPSAVASKKYTAGGAESILVWDDDFSSIKTANTTALKSLNGSKTGFKDAYTIIANCYPEVSSIKMSSGKTIGSLQTPKFTKLSGSSSVVVTVEYAGYGTDGGTLNLSVVGNGELNMESLTATNTATSGAAVETWDKATFVISGADKDTALKISASAKGKRFFINSIKIETN